MKAKSQARILFAHNNAARFVQIDRDILQSLYPLTDYYVSSRRLNLADLWRQVRTHDVVFGWFSSWHMFFPLLFAHAQRKPSVLVIGGYDIANLPEIGYGHQRGGVKKWVSRMNIGMANCLITNAQYSQEEAHRNTGVAVERVNVVYHGVPDPVETLPSGRRARMALTVGNVDRANLWRKGLEPFVRAAALLPDVEFAVVGGWKDDAIAYLRSIATPNVIFTGRISDEQLNAYYCQASAYVQVSAHEGFGMSLAEAMLAGCIPVVTRNGALPEVVGDCGVYAEAQTAEATADAIRRAMKLPESTRREARRRIEERFTLQYRQQELGRLVENVLNA